MSFTTNLDITKNYPAVIYNGTEGSDVYHEDHEVDGVMYRAANAFFNELLPTPAWQQIDTGQPSYALFQNTDGSTGYLYMPAGSPNWSAWQGAGQPVTYYAVNYGLTSGDMTGGTNTPALNAAVTALIAAGGGTLSIPAGTYFVNGRINIAGSAAAGIIIAGVSGQTTLVQLNGYDIFDVTGMNADQGVRFRDLFLKYASMTVTSTLCAINVVDSNFVTCEGVYFSNCPTAFQTDLDCEFCGLVNCWINYDLRDNDDNAVDNQTMISLSGAESFVANCVLHQQPLDSTPRGPTNCTGILLTSNTGARFISDSHIDAFAVGIQITHSVDAVYCSNLKIDAYQNAVTITPSSAPVYTVHFSSCTFGCVAGATSPTSGVLINSSGADVAGIYFTNCVAFGWGSAGIEIDGGENIVITGGQYSSNGQYSPNTYLSAGIAITGGSQVTISGADCSGVNKYYNPGSPAQPYGIAISNTVADVSNVIIDGCNVIANHTNGIIVAQLGSFTLDHVLISNCNARGYSSYSSAINISGASTDLTNVHVTNCAGYNDAGKVFTPAITSGSTFYPYTFGYWGPVECYIANGASTTISSITIDGTVIPLKLGSFLLVPGESASISWTPLSLAISLVAIGK